MTDAIGDAVREALGGNQGHHGTHPRRQSRQSRHSPEKAFKAIMALTCEGRSEAASTPRRMHVSTHVRTRSSASHGNSASAPPPPSPPPPPPPLLAPPSLLSVVASRLLGLCTSGQGRSYADARHTALMYAERTRLDSRGAAAHHCAQWPAIARSPRRAVCEASATSRHRRNQPYSAVLRRTQARTRCHVAVALAAETTRAAAGMVAAVKAVEAREAEERAAETEEAATRTAATVVARRRRRWRRRRGRRRCGW
jgi:hypothetical protein